MVEGFQDCKRKLTTLGICLWYVFWNPVLTLPVSQVPQWQLFTTDYNGSVFKNEEKKKGSQSFILVSSNTDGSVLEIMNQICTNATSKVHESSNFKCISEL